MKFCGVLMTMFLIAVPTDGHDGRDREPNPQMIVLRAMTKRVLPRPTGATVRFTHVPRSTVQAPLVFGDGADKTEQKLRIRVQEFLSLMVTDNDIKLYDFLDRDARKGYGEVGQFIEFRNSCRELGGSTLRAFAITEVGFLTGGLFSIVRGCGDYFDGVEHKYLASNVEAVYEDGEWYFRSLIGADYVFGVPPKRCSSSWPYEF